MTSAISGASSSQSQILQATQQQGKAGRDIDGDNDGSKAGEVESMEKKSPVSATVGNNVNTAA